MSEAQIIECPCRINTSDGHVFRVDEIGAWGYTPYGIFATGHWERDDGEQERDLLIPYQSIAYIQFDFDALARFQEHDDGEEDERAEDTSD